MTLHRRDFLAAWASLCVPLESKANPPIMIDLHCVERPHPALGDAAKVFDRFAGSWSLSCVLTAAGGSKTVLEGEWHFGWILGGRAMQDVIVLYRGAARPRLATDLQAGTSVRVFDPRTRQWQVSYFAPVRGDVIHLRGGAVGERVVLLGRDVDGAALVIPRCRRCEFQLARRNLGGRWIDVAGGAGDAPDPSRKAVDENVKATALPVWDWLDRPGLEAASVSVTPEAVEMAGVVVTVMDGTPLRLRYGLSLTVDWRFLRACFDLEIESRKLAMAIARETEGWKVDGHPRPDLAPCDDIDIMGSPSTNVLPIRRLDWAPGQARALQMAYVRLPDLVVLPVSQRYTRLEEHRFEYRSVESGFRAELRVDADGLVLDYPPYWRRVR